MWWYSQLEISVAADSQADRSQWQEVILFTHPFQNNNQLGDFHDLLLHNLLIGNRSGRRSAAKGDWQEATKGGQVMQVTEDLTVL